MPTAPLGEVEIFYETRGDPAHPPVLLVAGLGMQLVGWGEDWLARLAAERLFLVVYDNRDVGLSTHLDEAGMPDLLALFEGRDPHVSYRLADMADDAAGLLAHLGIPSAHVVGISMGGMIAQELAIRHPALVRSLCSVMSTTGAPGVGQPSHEAVHELLRPAPETREEAAELAVATFAVIGSPGYPAEDERNRRLALGAYERSDDPRGVARQLGAILASPDRTEALAAVVVPTLVLHGREDVLVHVSGGEATAAAVPGARLVVFDGMGHSLPVPLWDPLVAEIVANVRRGDERRAAVKAAGPA